MCFLQPTLIFGHANILKFCKRPFNSVDDMNEALIQRWNERVGKRDHIYVLGDFALCGRVELETILDRLNGQKYLVRGGHDRITNTHERHFKSIAWMMNINIEKQPITLCHYPMMTWEKSHYNSWSAFGHHHFDTSKWFTGKMVNVGVDLHDYAPISFEEICTYMKTRGDNLNKLRKHEHDSKKHRGRCD